MTFVQFLLLTLFAFTAHAQEQECTTCTDEPSETMVTNGDECTTFSRLNQRCNASQNWERMNTCQLSCYLAGLGYKGDVCCTEDGEVITMSPVSTDGEIVVPVPTVAPTISSPLEAPVVVAPLIPDDLPDDSEGASGKKGSKKEKKSKKESKKAKEIKLKHKSSKKSKVQQEEA
mmetsp:Transcript_11612/g.17050  ORF Transcript_11612/g.17050 Transcript_11612/m.17050 type:complete len:174 (-) Transcript_11612:1868-2389(-)